MSTGTLIIVRPRQWCDRWRRYRIMVDGEEVGRIAAGEELSVELPHGPHLVVARIDWARSNPLLVGVRAGDVIEVEVGANARGWLLLAGLYFATFGCWQYLYLRPRVTGFPVSLPTRSAR